MQFFCGSWIPSYLLSFLYWENILWNAFEYFFCNVLAYMAPTTKTTYVLLSKSYLLFLQWTSISITILVFVSKWASFHDTAKCSWLSCTFVQIISTSWCTIIWMQDYVIDLQDWFLQEVMLFTVMQIWCLLMAKIMKTSKIFK